jgi:hypothetical protein
VDNRLSREALDWRFGDQLCDLDRVECRIDPQRRNRTTRKIICC